jgi:hypothetical protein
LMAARSLPDGASSARAAAAVPAAGLLAQAASVVAIVAATSRAPTAPASGRSALRVATPADFKNRDDALAMMVFLVFIGG